MADQQARIAIGMELDASGFEKGYKELEKVLLKVQEKILKIAAEQSAEVEKNAQIQVEVVSEAEKKKIEKIKEGLQAVIETENAKINEIRRSIAEQTAIEKAKPGLDLAAQIQAIRDAKAAEIAEIKKGLQEQIALKNEEIENIKEGLKQQEADVKKSMNSQLKVVQDTAKKQLKAIQDEYGKSGNSVKDFVAGAGKELLGLEGVLSAAAGGPAGWGKLAVEMGKKAVAALNEMAAAYREQEQAEFAFQNAAKNNPYLNDSMVRQLKAFAGEMQRTTGIDSVQILQTEAGLAGMGRTQEQIQKIVKTAADMAASGIVSFDEAVNELNNSYNGMMGTSSKLYPELKNLSQEALAAGGAIDLIAGKVAGSAAAAMNTGAGSVKAYENALGDLKKHIGEGWEESTQPARNWITGLLEKINETLSKRKMLGEADAALKPGAGQEDEIKKRQDEIKKLEKTYKEFFIESNNIFKNHSEEEKARLQETMDNAKKRIGVLNNEIEALEGIGPTAEKQYELAEAKIAALQDDTLGFMRSGQKALAAMGGAASLSAGLLAAPAFVATFLGSEVDRITKKFDKLEEGREEALLYAGKLLDELKEKQETYGETVNQIRQEELEEYNKIIDAINARAEAGEMIIGGTEHLLELKKAEFAFEAEILGLAKQRFEAETKAEEEKSTAQTDARKEINDALEKEIELIIQKAKIEGKTTKDLGVQKQILNVRINAYTNLIGKIGAAGEAEKRMLAELQAENVRLETESANQLQEENLRRLDAQKREITLKAGLEGRVSNSIQTQNELLDAEINAYNNQLKIIRDIIDGTREEDSERRSALETQWKQYALEVQTRTAQKERLDEMLAHQEEINKKINDMYDTAQGANEKHEYDAALRELTVRRMEAERKSGKERLKEEININEELVIIKTEYLRRERAEKLKNLDIEIEEARKNAEAEGRMNGAGRDALLAAEELGKAKIAETEATEKQTAAWNANNAAKAESNRLAAKAAEAAEKLATAEHKAASLQQRLDSGQSSGQRSQIEEDLENAKAAIEEAKKAKEDADEAVETAANAAISAAGRYNAALAERGKAEAELTNAIQSEREKRAQAEQAADEESLALVNEFAEKRNQILLGSANEDANLLVEQYMERINELTGRGAIEQAEALKDELITRLKEIEEEVANEGIDVSQDIANRITLINEDVNEKIVQLIQDNLAKIQDFLNQAMQMADGISTVWKDSIDAELEEKLRANDAMEQSDEDRAAKEKDLRKQAAKERYKADLFAWTANVIKATAAAALAVLDNLGNIPMAILASVMGAMQVAAVISAKPVPPSFHSGGVVQGRSGQEIPAILRAKEVVTTQGQFNNIMQAFAGMAGMKGGSTEMNVKVINNAAADTRVSQQMDADGLKITVEKIMEDSMAQGRLDKGFAGKDMRDKGRAVL